MIFRANIPPGGRSLTISQIYRQLDVKLVGKGRQEIDGEIKKNLLIPEIYIDRGGTRSYNCGPMWNYVVVKP